MKELNFNRGQEMPPPVHRTRFGGQWEYHFNYGVKQDEEGYAWLSVVTPAGVWDKGAAVRAMIRQRYSADDVEAIINNVLNAPGDEERVAEYRALQEWRKLAKRSAAECIAWGNENGVCEEPGSETPSEETADLGDTLPDGLEQMIQAVTLARMQVVDLPDERALEVPALFPTWESYLGKPVEAGLRLLYAGRLWKVLQAHTVQADWTPDVAASLFTEVVVQGDDEPEIGTLNNPIPYNGNMELEEGKYYSQDGVTYLCIRSTGTPVYHPLAQLVGLYVEVVEQS